jgi:hypothetical protein
MLDPAGSSEAAQVAHAGRGPGGVHLHSGAQQAGLALGPAGGAHLGRPMALDSPAPLGEPVGQIGRFVFRGRSPEVFQVMAFLNEIGLHQWGTDTTSPVDVVIDPQLRPAGRYDDETRRILLNPQHPAIAGDPHRLCCIALMEVLNAQSAPRLRAIMASMERGDFERLGPHHGRTPAMLYARAKEALEYDNTRQHVQILSGTRYRNTPANAYPAEQTFAQYLEGQKEHLLAYVAAYEGYARPLREAGFWPPPD